jgi:hypothetical protein
MQSVPGSLSHLILSGDDSLSLDLRLDSGLGVHMPALVPHVAPLLI